MRIVIATDLSGASLAAVDSMTACNPLEFSGIVLVHAVALDLYTAGGTVPEVIEYAEEHLRRIAMRLEDAGFETTVRVEVGSAVDVIERAIAEEGAELVVMTNLGKGAAIGRLLGSTAEVLASASRVPVMIERVGEDAGAWCRTGVAHPFSKVLVGADLSPSLPAQLALVCGLPGLGEIRVVHVAEPGGDESEVRERLITLSEGRVCSAPFETVLRIGTDPARALLAEAEAWGATLVVVSPRTHGVLHRALWGSTARTVAKHSTLPVLFVPPGDVRVSDIR